MNRWRSWVLLAAGAAAGCGGMEVSGIVRDEETGKPLPGAVVRVGDDVTRTDNAGNYSLEVDADADDPVQTYVAAPGYQPQTDFTSVGDDQERLMRDFQLKKREDEQQRRTSEEEAVDRALRERRERIAKEADAIIIVPRHDDQQGGAARQAPQEPRLYEGDLDEQGELELRPIEPEELEGAGQPEGGAGGEQR